MNEARVIVIGGGPAGIMAAGRAAQMGARVVLLEKGPKLARKLRISGKGRGNITNTAPIDEFVEAFAPNGKFLYGAFSRFFSEDLIALLQSLGVETKVERGGRVFPASDRAGDIADAMERWARELGVRIKAGTSVRSIAVEDGRVTGVEVFGGRMAAGAVVIATGGASYPKTGSTGDGYAMARELGHTIVPPKPGLSALLTEEKWVGDIQGLSLKNVRATLLAADSTPVASEFGEMLFAHFGISGPIILTLSRRVRRMLEAGPVIVSIDLKPALTEEQLRARLIRDFAGNKMLRNYLPELLPRLMAELFPSLAKIDADKRTNSITSDERKRIISALKDLRLTARGLAPLEEAIVTAGGVSVKEIDPKTMMSKLISGLFFAGEVIDVDAETGGFNIQAAFSTGWVAGESVARCSLCRSATDSAASGCG